MRFLRVVLSAVVVSIGLVLVSWSPAHACSCVMADDAKYLTWSDVAFHGTLTDASGGDPRTYEFDVDQVIEGEAAETTEVLSAGSGAACGLEGMEEGEEYVVFATYDDDRSTLSAGLCGGTRAMDAAGLTHLEDRLGLTPADPPLPGVMEAEGGDDGIAPWTVAVPALLLAAGAGVLLRRRRRHKM